MLKYLIMAEHYDVVGWSSENFILVSEILAPGVSAVPAVKQEMQLGHLKMTYLYLSSDSGARSLLKCTCLEEDSFRSCCPTPYLLGLVVLCRHRVLTGQHENNLVSWFAFWS